MDKYEKKYTHALEVVRELQKDWASTQNRAAREIELAFPELRESEDERIRKWLHDYIYTCPNESFEFYGGVGKDVVLAWLEKQKENPKKAISIPADCVSNAKCEDRWNKTANSLPDNGRDVLAKDALGNYLLASFDGAQWFVSVYDGEDHPVLHTPPILEWCDIPSETYKESLHIPESCKENADSFTSEDEKTRKWILDKVQGYADSGIPCSDEIQMANKALAWLEEQKDKNCLTCDQHLKGYIAGRKVTEEEKQKEQKPVEYLSEEKVFAIMKKLTSLSFCVPLGSDEEKQIHEITCGVRSLIDYPIKPAEWSEEDEKRMDAVIELLENTSAIHPNYSHRKLIIWLKSLRPSWKPSEEQMNLLLNIEGDLRAFQYNDKAKALAELYEQLKRM